LLRHIFTDMPDRREAVARTLASHGSRRRYVSRNRQDLYVAKSGEWVRRHSVEIVDGWFADKNLSGAQMRANLRRALRTVGLRLGTDVIIHWHARRDHTHQTTIDGLAHRRESDAKSICTAAISVSPAATTARTTGELGPRG
jgi:hypothetical protein